MKLRTDEFLFFSLNLPAARDYYINVLGCSLLGEEDWGFCLLSLPDGARIGLMHPRNWSGWREGESLPEPVLCLRTDDLDTALAQLRERGASCSEPDGQPGQARGCRLTDPDGRTIYLFEDPAEPC
ncbi:VOC family protein [bacterium]|nr:VOC family protein [bacterium]MCB1216257.1 VOC family protein [bacterium]